MRWQVLAAKLVVYAGLGLAYGLLSTAAAVAAMYAGGMVRGVSIGVPITNLVPALAWLVLAAATYLIIGVAIGALTRHQILAIGIVIGYFYFLE